MLQTAGIVFEIIVILWLTCMSFKIFYQKRKSMLNHLFLRHNNCSVMVIWNSWSAY